jgi:hypothetical protein
MTMRATLSPSSKDRRPGQMQIRALIRDGVTGLLCEPGDSVDLARRIPRLLDDQTCGARWAWPGRPRYEEDFVGENVIDQYFRPLLGSATAKESERREVKNSGV